MSLTRNFLLQIQPEWHYDALGPILRMIEHTIHIDIGQSKILNLDADEQRNFIAFTDTKTVITNYHILKIDIEIRFPIIRRLNNEMFLIADSRTDNSVNGYIYNFSRQIVKSFLAVDGILIKNCRWMLICSYILWNSLNLKHEDDNTEYPRRD